MSSSSIHVKYNNSKSVSNILFHHSSPGDFSQSSSDIHPSKSLYGGRKCPDQLVDLVGGVVVPANKNDLVSFSQRSSNLGSDGGQSLQDQRHHGRVTIIFIGSGLQPHTLSLGLANSLNSPGLSPSDQFDLLSLSLGGLHHLGPVALGHCLHLEG